MSRKSIKKGKKSVPDKTPKSSHHLISGERFLRISLWSFFYTGFFLILLLYVNPPVIFSDTGLNVHGYVSSMHRQDALKDSSVQYVDPWINHLYILEMTPKYLHDVFSVPGGISGLLVTLCIYACHNAIAGALVMTLLAIIFNLLLSAYISGLCGRKPLFAGFIPSIFILTICAWYEPWYLSFLIPITCALVFTLIYQRFGGRRIAFRMLAISVLFWLSWYFVLWGCMATLLLMVIHELFCKDRKIAILFVTAVVNTLIFYSADAFFVPYGVSVRWMDFFALNGLILAAVLFFPVISVYSALSAWLVKKSTGNIKKRAAIFETAAFTLCIILFVSWLFADPINRNTRTVARTVHHVNNGMWDAVLGENTKTIFKGFPDNAGALQLFMVHAIDQAMFHKGEIGEKLFKYPQVTFSFDPLLMLGSANRNGLVNWMVVMDLAMDLGLLNTAEKIAGEIMEKMGPYPDVLYKRSMIQIAKGNYETASVFLGRLSNIPFYHSKARKLLDEINRKTVFESEPAIASMRANMDTVDYFIFNGVAESDILKYLLQSNLSNRAAYDYLMTHYMITGQLDNLTEIAPAAASFGYFRLPRYWEEALCLNLATRMMSDSSAAQAFSGISQETMDRFSAFTKEYLRFENDPQAASKLEAAFGDTYFYFSIFRHSTGAHHE